MTDKYIKKTITIYCYAFMLCNKDTKQVREVNIESFVEAKNPKQLRAIFDTSKYVDKNYFVKGDFKGTRFEAYKLPIQDFVKIATKIDLPATTDSTKDKEEDTKNEQDYTTR